VRLYAYWRSSSAWRVRIVLEVKGFVYEYIAINLGPQALEQSTAAYAEINPLQQVPILEWQDGSERVRLSQSVAIIEYLEELRSEPALCPRDRLARARVREAVQIVNSGMQPLQNSSTLAEIKRVAGDAVMRSWACDVMVPGFHALEAHAERFAGRCSVGDALSWADVYLVPQLYNARRWGLSLAAFPRLLAIESYLNELPAFQRARPEAQPDAPPA
jgi:maleylpyruvate isomerase